MILQLRTIILTVTLIVEVCVVCYKFPDLYINNITHSKDDKDWSTSAKYSTEHQSTIEQTTPGMDVCKTWRVSCYWAPCTLCGGHFLHNLVMVFLSSKVSDMQSSSLTSVAIYDLHPSKCENLEFFTSSFFNRR